MKKILLFPFLLLSLVSVAQTATNFNANDCNGTNHDLFSELNSGKVVVITWVMPCSNCIGGATSAQNAVNSFSASNPGQVVHYVADDYGNSTCSVVTSWCTTNSITPAAVFSSSVISMSDYGSDGMPKVVVLGGTNHTVYYNTNGSGSISATGVQSAISSALSAVGIKNQTSPAFRSVISPNPVNNELKLMFERSSNTNVELYSAAGQEIMRFKNITGKDFSINTESVANGTYFAKISNSEYSEIIKFIVIH